MNFKLKKMYTILLLVLFASHAGIILCGAEQRKLSSEAKERIKYSQDKKKSLTAGLFTPITFYGKVIDQHKDPVPNVKLAIGMTVFSPNPFLYYQDHKTVFIKTDAKGEFVFKGIGRDMNVALGVPEGYDRDDSPYNPTFYYAQAPDEPEKILHIPDKNNPVLFTLRKKFPAVLSVDFSHEMRGLAVDKDYYGDMFYEPKEQRKVTADDVTKINSEKFYPQVKVRQTYQKENDTTHIFTLDVDFLSDFHVQQGEKGTLILPEKGYDKKHYRVTYKVVNCPIKDRNEYYRLTEDKGWIPYDRSVFFLFAKTHNNHYGKVTLHWSPSWYFRRQHITLRIKYLFNTVPDQRVFEDDSDLRLEIEPKRFEEWKEKIQNECIKTKKSLSELLEQEAKKE